MSADIYDGGYKSKNQLVRELVQSGEYMGALSIAHKFKILKPEDRLALERCWGAHKNPDFYRQLGLNIQHLKDEGVRVLLELWGTKNEQ